MRLTDISIRALKPPERGQKTHFDDGLTGFGVRVSQGGTKTFVLMHGADRKLTSIGRVGIVSLAQARQKAKRLLAEQMLGIRAEESATFQEALDAFLASCEGRIRPRTVYDYRRLLNRHFGRFAKRRLSAIPKSEFVEAVDRLKGTPVEQNHAFAAGRTFFRYCVSHGLLTQSPFEAMKLPARIRTRDRTLDPQELAAVYRAAEEIGYPFGTIVQLLILTGERKGEIAALEWGWIGDDAITIPKTVAKNHREHTFPIGSIVRSVLANVPKNDSRLFTVYNWDSKTNDLRARAGIPHFVLHDLRRSYASGMASLGVAPHVVERLLNHVSGTVSGVAAVYNRYTYAAEMREAVTAWERRLEKLLAPR